MTDRAVLRIVVNPTEFQNAKIYHLRSPDGYAEALRRWLARDFSSNRLRAAAIAGRAAVRNTSLAEVTSTT